VENVELRPLLLGRGHARLEGAGGQGPAADGIFLLALAADPVARARKVGAAKRSPKSRKTYAASLFPAESDSLKTAAAIGEVTSKSTCRGPSPKPYASTLGELG
jgi:hypothetical protein